MYRTITIPLVLVILMQALAFASDPITITDPVWDTSKGVWRYTVTTPYQKGPNAVEVLLPDKYERSRKYRVLYVLPVETSIGGRYGDGLVEVRKTNAHNDHDLICVQMAFDTIPWYGDHPTDPQIRQEQYLKKVVVPMIELRYATRGDREGRLLLGFSKSGWGAFTLMARDPNFFGYAAAWDSPLMMLAEDFNNFGIPQNMGTAENFAKYLPRKLFEEHAADFQKRSRIVLLGHWAFGPEPRKKFRDHTEEMHELLDKLNIPHSYDNSLHVQHTWSSGWVKPAIEAIAKLSQ